MDKAISALFTSRVRIKILQLFILHPREMFYVREIVRRVEEEINAVRRELERLLEIGLLQSEKRANRLYYFLRTDFLYYPELLRIIGKSTNLGGKIIKNKAKLGNVKYALLAASFLKGRIASSSQVDFLVVGKVNLSILKELISESEKEHNHEINYTVMTEEEFKFRKKRRDPFVSEILSQTQIVLIGDEEELNRRE